MKKPRALYSIDWMQVFCISKTADLVIEGEKISPLCDKYGNHRVYKITSSNIYMAGYKEVRDVRYKNYDIATIAWLPSDERRRRDGCAIKLANPILYVSDWFGILNELLYILKWEIHNITRVDLACDVNYFIGGLLPSTFIRNYVSKTNNSYLRHGSNKWACYGRKEMRVNVYDSIRWGSRSSGVSVYLYNKSKELKEVKNKPWIKTAWEKAELNTTKDVWRVEISITSQGLGLKRIADGCFHTLFTEDLMTPEMIKDMFLSFASVYFKFFRTDIKAKRKRDLKEVKLLPAPPNKVFLPCTIKENIGAGRMEKIISNKLASLYDYLVDRDFMEKIETLEKIKDIENIYNSLYMIKQKTHKQEILIKKDIEKDVYDALGMEHLRQYGRSLKEGERYSDIIRQHARDLARQIIDTNFTKPKTA